MRSPGPKKSRARSSSAEDSTGPASTKNNALTADAVATTCYQCPGGRQDPLTPVTGRVKVRARHMLNRGGGLIRMAPKGL